MKSLRLLFMGVVAGVGLASVAERPNVVIFFPDDQGTLDANCYGSTDLVTPDMDRLARDGVRFGLTNRTTSGTQTPKVDPVLAYSGPPVLGPCE